MLKTRIAVGLSVLLCASLFVLPVAASVSGPCSNCHTMHNSQSGSAVAEVWDSTTHASVSAGPQQTLLKNDCVGCHASTGSATITSDGTPIVYNTQDPTNPLAGGNFYWVEHDGGDAYGHNVLGISAEDATLEYAPGPVSAPGSGPCDHCHASLATDPSTEGYDFEGGCQGCHVPKHHADDSATVVGETGGFFRFLGLNAYKVTTSADPHSGVIGIEDPNWEQNPSSGHNVYQGTENVYARSIGSFIQYNSVGSFCAGCHGQFHHIMNEGQNGDMFNEGDVSGAWLRHPSDVLVPDAGEYAGLSTYNVIAPVARVSVVDGDANFTTINHDRDVVTCLSCHRAHGSPYPDMLRWDYNSCSSTGGEGPCGCYVCHTTKD